MLSAAYETISLGTDSGVLPMALVVMSVATCIYLLIAAGRLATRRWSKYQSKGLPNFPKQRVVMLEKSADPRCAQPCSTDAEFQYQIQDFCSLDDLYQPFQDDDVIRPVPQYQYQIVQQQQYQQQLRYLHHMHQEEAQHQQSEKHEPEQQDQHQHQYQQHQQQHQQQQQQQQQQPHFEQHEQQVQEPLVVKEETSSWKEEAPIYVHPSVSEELPIELWLPEELAAPNVNSNSNSNSLTSSPNSGTADSVGPEPMSVPKGGEDVLAATPYNLDPHLDWAGPEEVDQYDELSAVMFGAKQKPSFGSAQFAYGREHSQQSQYDLTWNSPPEPYAPVASSDFAHNRGPLGSSSGGSSLGSTAGAQMLESRGNSALGSRSLLERMGPTGPAKKVNQISKSRATGLYVSSKRGYPSPSLPSPPHSARTGSESGSDSNETIFKCPDCPATFRIRGYLTRHMKKHADTMKFNCPFYKCLAEDRKCHQTGGFSRRDTFKMHLKARHFAYPTGTARKDRPKCAGKCCGCNRVFGNNELWIEDHLLAGECPMTEVDSNYDINPDPVEAFS